MKEENDFELPVGFTFSLGMNQKALQYFAGLEMPVKQKIKEYIRQDTTSEVAKQRIELVVYQLENHSLDFLSS